MSHIETVAKMFANYQAEVLPPNAPAIQIEECRRAFYTGSYCLLMNVAHHIGDDSMDEDAGIAQLEALKAECEAFAAAGGLPPLQKVQVIEQSGYNVRHQDVETALREIATQIKPQIPKGFGFTLLIFSYGKMGLKGEGDAGAMFYISTGQREDMVKAMREFIARNTQ